MTEKHPPSSNTPSPHSGSQHAKSEESGRHRPHEPEPLEYVAPADPLAEPSLDTPSGYVALPSDDELGKVIGRRESDDAHPKQTGGDALLGMYVSRERIPQLSSPAITIDEGPPPEEAKFKLGTLIKVAVLLLIFMLLVVTFGAVRVEMVDREGVDVDVPLFQWLVAQVVMPSEQREMQSLPPSERPSIITQLRIQEVYEAAVRYELRTRQAPSGVEDLVREGLIESFQSLDGWGSRFYIEGRGNRLTVRSPGVDGMPNTEADIVISDYGLAIPPPSTPAATICASTSSDTPPPVGARVAKETPEDVAPAPRGDISTCGGTMRGLGHSRTTRVFQAALLLAVGLGAGFFAATHPWLGKFTEPKRAVATPYLTPDDELRPLPEVVQMVSPGVVSIGAVKRAVVLEPYINFFDFFAMRPRETLRRSPYMGSGFLVDREGHILTNYHVIQDSEQVFVTLSDGREYEAEILDADLVLDIALLKIDPNGNGDLPEPLQLGNSDALQIGEPAIALGNPFGNLIEDPRPTVTTGVISALHRSFRPDREQRRIYQDMIQTDAAINPGNSGGPLLDRHGRVVGINTFIVSRTGANIGLGFAIPINRARAFYEEVKTYGRLRPLAIDFATMTINTQRIQGILISAMEREGPAEEAGLAIGDVITHVEGRRVRTREELLLNLAGFQFGDEVTFGVWRQGETREVNYTMNAEIDEEDLGPPPQRRRR